MVPLLRRSAVAALLLGGALGCRGDKVDPPRPTVSSAWVDTLPPVPTSYLDVPVRYDLAPAMRWLEAEVPRTIGSLDERHGVAGKKRVHFAFEATRSPFRLAVDGRTATLEADVRYRVRGWYD